ncbi:hypothetical protein Q2T42_19035 [Leptolyngbya boryana CZ1]|uniref:STAS domain-containing protein n=2 Tax=Leptolyngbya group TaxID=3081713 RepID=A0AA96WTD9_LEPBY|nr:MULTISPECIES: hypothetical protein [Leptolyngbya]WNZ43934.1 hypothetical protein Q2T42_19035 [Leptolyngbya boryana CZ1]
MSADRESREMEITSEKYSIEYDETTNTVACRGALRLAGMEDYAPIVQLLDQVLQYQPAQLMLNLQELEFLNSSGINVLSKFVLKVRGQENMRLIVQGSTAIPWQERSLKNLQRLMPQLELTWD